MAAAAAESFAQGSATSVSARAKVLERLTLAHRPAVAVASVAARPVSVVAESVRPRARALLPVESDPRWAPATAIRSTSLA